MAVTENFSGLTCLRTVFAKFRRNVNFDALETEELFEAYRNDAAATLLKLAGEQSLAPEKISNPELLNAYNGPVLAALKNGSWILIMDTIDEDGYTQPIVVWLRDDCRFEVVDGFHRYMIGKKKQMSHLPCVIVNRCQQERNDRMAATIRHNRARGKHQVAEMSKIVLELKRRNWSDAKIGKNLGMEPDEVLRLSQDGGLAELFKDKDFSEAWK